MLSNEIVYITLVYEIAKKHCCLVAKRFRAQDRRGLGQEISWSSSAGHSPQSRNLSNVLADYSVICL